MPPFLMRMLLWLRNPPSRPQQIAIAVVCGIGLLAVGIEHVLAGPIG